MSNVNNIRRPDFFIVGAPKCGTTSMAEYLRQHPDVFVAHGEPHFFGSDIHYHPKRITEEEYLQYFSGARHEKRVGEKSTWYLYSRRAAAEIKRFCPYAKIIIQIRNPAEVLYSLHGHLVYHSAREDIVDFEAALEAEKDRRRGFRIPKQARFPEHLFYSEIPLYVDQIQRYVDAFGWEQLHIIAFDDLLNDVAGVYREVLRFLDVDDKFVPEFKVYNPQRPTKSILLRKFMRSTWIRAIGRVILPGTIRHSIGKTLSNWNTRDAKPPMDKKTQEKLQKQFAPEVERLSELLGRDLTHWCNIEETL